MTETSSRLIEKLRLKAGKEWELGVYQIEKGMIRRFAQAINDPNPLWQDEEFTKEGEPGTIIAPPTFISTIGFEQIEHMLTEDPSVTILHGGTKLECYQPVRSGDRITATARIANVREMKSKTGIRTFIIFNTRFENQRQELVAECRQTVISY
jgi:acyl dehydratase